MKEESTVHKLKGKQTCRLQLQQICCSRGLFWGFFYFFLTSFMSKYIITYMQILGRREARILTLSGPVVLLHVGDMEIGCDGLLWALKEQADLADILQAYLSYLAHKMFGFSVFSFKNSFQRSSGERPSEPLPPE